METQLVFALPAQSDEVSGGNLYNEHLLRALGRVRPVTGTTVAACRLRIEHGLPGCYFVDSLDLQSLVSFPEPRPGQSLGLVVHHLPSLEPGIDPADPALALEASALSRCDLFLATSPFTAQRLRERGFDEHRILTVLPAPPTGAGALPRPAPPFVFAVVGNLIPRKGVLPLLECLADQLQDTDQFQLELAGRTDVAPAYARACLERAQTPRLRAIVRYLGAVPHAHIGAGYRRAAAFVSASSMETFGMALQEARAYGLPILALDGGYVREHFTPGHNGFLFDSVGALAGQLLAFVREPARLYSLFDEAQRSRLASGYTWDSAAEQLLCELERCQRSGRSP